MPAAAINLWGTSQYPPADVDVSTCTVTLTIGATTYQYTLADWLTNSLSLNLLFTNLPTSLPATAGLLWNNSGVICIS